MPDTQAAKSAVSTAIDWDSLISEMVRNPAFTWQPQQFGPTTAQLKTQCEMNREDYEVILSRDYDPAEQSSAQYEAFVVKVEDNSTLCIFEAATPVEDRVEPCVLVVDGTIQGWFLQINNTVGNLFNL